MGSKCIASAYKKLQKMDIPLIFKVSSEVFLEISHFLSGTTVTSVLPEFLGSFYPLLEQLTNGRLTGNPKSPGQ